MHGYPFRKSWLKWPGAEKKNIKKNKLEISREQHIILLLKIHYAGIEQCVSDELSIRLRLGKLNISSAD